VLVAVRDNDAASPFDAVVKNLAHETKLKNWKGMSAEEKALSKLADVLDQVRGRRRCAVDVWGLVMMELLALPGSDAARVGVCLRVRLR
jgi:hypothetical protein